MPPAAPWIDRDVAVERLKRSVRDAGQAAGFRYRAATTSARRGDRADPLRLLLVTDFAGYTSDQQYAPVRRHAAALARESGINAAVMSLGSVRRRGRRFLRRFDVVGVKKVFRSPVDEVVGVVDALRDGIGPDARLVYFDGDDDLNVQWPEVISAVDLYVKKHVFADPSRYAETYRGKSNLTEYVAEEFGVDALVGTTVSSGPLAPEAIERIRLGWNIALDDPIVRLVGAGMVSPRTGREVDVSGRAPARAVDWVKPVRDRMKESLRALDGRWRVEVPETRVSQEDYHRELRSSRICVSPFGYGEICWRDFEAIAAGCLLVKPDMGHVATDPDVFVPGVTYAPVAWDYSDLAEVCAEYLGDDRRRQQVAAEAQRVLVDAMRPGWLADRLNRVLA